MLFFSVSETHFVNPSIFGYFMLNSKLLFIFH
jgi:hypothetical protein